MAQSYNASDIEVLSGLDPVRRRPGMYTDTSRPNHLAHEVVDNSVDEALSGHAKRVDPYISGGIGVVTLDATIFTVNPLVVNPLLTTLETQNVSGSRFGWDVGGGLMAWSEKNWGFRADVRYYKTGGNDADVFDIDDIGDGSLFSRVELSGLSFWKANAGIGFRW